MNRYFYIDATGKQVGTFSPEELRLENIKHDTLVWTQGMEQWQRAEEVEDIRHIFQTPYDPPVNNYSEAKEEPSVIQPMPKSWLIEAILITVLPFAFCGSVLSLIGIVAIVYAGQVESAYSRGDYAASLQASQSAGRWTRITLWVLVVWIVLIIAAIILMFGVLGFTMSGMGNLINT